jgi:hypothetical protein
MVEISVLFLIAEDNPTAKYFLQVALVFVASMSMLSLIIIPIMVQLRRRRMNGPRRGRVIVSGLPLEQTFSATIATAGLPSTSINTEAAKVRVKSLWACDLIWKRILGAVRLRPCAANASRSL